MVVDDGSSLVTMILGPCSRSDHHAPQKKTSRTGTAATGGAESEEGDASGTTMVEMHAAGKA